MREATAAVNLPRFPRGTTMLVDDTDPRIKRLIRGGYLVWVDEPASSPVTRKPVKKKK